MALEIAVTDPAASPPTPLTRFFRRAWNSWATRSLAIGGVATLIDVAVLLVCVKGFASPTWMGAMIGVLFGATFTFFANRHFAFRDHNPKLAPQALKFALATGASMLLHAFLVGVMADRFDVPVVLAKFVADLLVFSVGQLLLLRYVVFPKAKATPENLTALPSAEKSTVLGAEVKLNVNA